MKNKHGTTFRKALCLWMGLVLFFPATAMAADLKYIRIGEHKDFTRIVFEFRGTVSFKKPEVKGKGNVAVVFLNTKTTLPKKIVSETAKWVDSISFSRKEVDLVATITFPFPFFEVKAFPLSKPERVVVDVKKTSAPPKGTIIEEPLAKKAPSALKTAVKPSPEVQEEQIKPVEQPKKQVPAVKPPSPAIPQKQEMAKVVQPEEPVQIPAQPKPQPKPEPKLEPKPVIQAQKGTTSPELGKKPPMKPMIEPVIRSIPEKIPSRLPTEEKRMEIYLLGALVFLSAIIVGLLLFTNFRRKRRRKASVEDDSYVDIGSLDETEDEKGLFQEESGDLGKSIEAVDAKIQNALKKIEKS